MAKILALVFTSLLSTMSLATEGADLVEGSSDTLEANTDALNERFENRYCQQYDRQPNLCNRIGYCQYDYQWDACRDRRGGGGGGGYRYCSTYNFDPQRCDAQANCRYNWQFRSCEDTWQPGPRPGPHPRPIPGPGPGNQCSYYSNNPRACGATPGCLWDRGTRSCVNDWIINPPPSSRPVATTLRCASSYQQGTNYCDVRGGTITAAYLQRQLSRAACIQGHTWGFDRNAIWVAGGCSAEFRVTYYRRPY